MAYDLQLFTNNAVSLLAAPISASATSLTVMSGYGVLYPNPGPGQFFLVTLENETGTVREIIRVTGRVGDTFTFPLGNRGQEGTVPVAWSSASGNDTLVDHRVTAETMRLAMLLPEGGSGGISGINIQGGGIPFPPPATTLNFTGNVAVIDNGASKDIVIGALTHDIHGGTPDPVNIPTGQTLPGDTTTYADNQRGFKFFVTLTMPATHQSQTFEVLGNISGDLSTNSETVSFNRSARVGYNFAGSVNLSINTALKQAKLTWTNNEANTVVIQCVRIQQTP